MSYLTPTFLAAEHDYRTARLARSWGGPLLPASWTHLLESPRRRRRAVPVPQVSPAGLSTNIAAGAVAAPTCLPEAAVTDYRERTLVSLR